LNNAALALSRIKRRTLLGTLDLIAFKSDYAAPTDCYLTKASTWGEGWINPWEKGYSPLPRMQTIEGVTGLTIMLRPAPTANQIACLGSKYTFFYLALHSVDDDATNTTFLPAHRDLFLTLALLEAMKELAVMGVTEPVQLHRGMGSSPANGTPSALVELLTKQVDRMR
jgi:hypothetical protein